MTGYGYFLEEFFDDEYILVAEDGNKEKELGALQAILKSIKDWKVSNEAFVKREFKSSTLSDDEYIEMKGIFKDLRKGNYETYKKAFNKLCSFCHIVPKGTIITSYKLTRGKEDRNSLYVEYSYNTKKIDLPEGVALYHMSKIGGIKKLKPTFRGKSERGYLYDKPRIYFTINKITYWIF